MFSHKASQCGQGHVARSRWNSRGWIYQEKLNSSRILYVVSNSLTLECRSGSWDTLTNWNPMMGGGFTRDATFLPAEGLPATTVNPRFLRNIFVAFTRLEDWWFAFSNVARAYSQGYGKEILDGLQREWILKDAIPWSDRVVCLVYPTVTSRYSDQGICRVCHLPDRCKSGVELLESRHSRFPTWSWLSTAWGIGRGVG